MDIVQILIFFGVILFITTKKYKEVSKNRPQQNMPDEEPLEDTFMPDGEEMPLPPFAKDEEGMMQPPFIRTDTDKRMAAAPDEEGKRMPPFSTFGKEMKRTPFAWAEAEKNIRSETDNTTTSAARRHRKATGKARKEEKMQERKAPEQREQKIRLNSRDDASRAFIYSEIFNRKY